MNRNPSIYFSFVAFVLFLTGCEKAQVTSYRVPKEDRMAQARKQLETLQGTKNVSSTDSASQITWTAPKGWVEQPATAMRKGSFLIAGKNDQKADMSIVTFPGGAGGDLANINRWRGQLQIPAIEELSSSVASSQKIQNQDFLIVDFVSTTPIQNHSTAQRLLGAILHQENQSWFFKMMGDDALVKEQKKNFLAFLATVKFGDSVPKMTDVGATQKTAPSEVTASPHEETPNTPKQLEWKLPKGWVEQPKSPMRLGSFQIPGKDGQKADVSIISLPGVAGGLSANIMMWRQQFELPTSDENDYTKDTTPLKMDLGEAFVLELVSQKAVLDGKQARMIVVVLPHGDQTWFFKMLGEDTFVASQKKAFLDFVKAVRISQ
jgi:hypothetical protein